MGVGGGEEAFFVLAGYVVVVLSNGGYHYLGMMGGLGLLLVVKNFLIELLAFAEAGELDFYAFCPRELYHALGKVDNADWGSHVEDEDFASLAHGAGFEDELACLWDEHEEADDVGMGDGDGTTLEQLLPEDGNDAAVAAQDIAKAGGDELGDALDLALLNGFVEGLAVDFADALGASHDIGGIDSLVGGNHDKLPGAILHSKVGNDTSTIDIILNSNTRIVLHHGHMLVGGCMENIIGAVGSKDLFHVLLVGNAADDGVTGYIGELACHHQADVVHGSLCLVDEDEGGGVVYGNLAYHLGTDGAGSTGDEDDLVLKQLSNGIHIDFYLVARQEVLDVHFTEVAVCEFGGAVPLLGGRHHHDVDTCSKELVHHLAVLAEHLCLER